MCVTFITYTENLIGTAFESQGRTVDRYHSATGMDGVEVARCQTSEPHKSVGGLFPHRLLPPLTFPSRVTDRRSQGPTTFAAAGE